MIADPTGTSQRVALERRVAWRRGGYVRRGR